MLLNLTHLLKTFIKVDCTKPLDIKYMHIAPQPNFVLGAFLAFLIEK